MPKRVNGREDFRIWNQQLISYAGYSDLESNGGLNGATTPAESELKCPVRGDPMNIEFTKVIRDIKTAVQINISGIFSLHLLMELNPKKFTLAEKEILKSMIMMIRLIIGIL